MRDCIVDDEARVRKGTRRHGTSRGLKAKKR